MSMSDIFDNTGDYTSPNDCSGVMPAVVTSIDDPDKLGRVKVKLLNRNTSDDETGFIRVMTPMVGAQWGMFFLPEVGDEVLVAFSGGDIARPYVLGSLWNQKKKPPVEIKDQKNDLRKIKTKSGHELNFYDENGKETIQLLTPKGLEMKLDDEKETIILKDKNTKNVIKIDVKNGMVTVESEKKISITAGNSKILLDGTGNTVSIESAQSLKIKSQQVSIEAQGALNLKSTGSLNVSADGPLSLKGAITKIN